MKTNSKRLIRIIKGCLDVAWYLNFVLAAIALSVLFYVYVTNGSNSYDEWSADVNIHRHHEISKIQVATDAIKDVALTTHEADLELKIKNSLFVRVSSFSLLVAIEFLIFSIIYNLRKLFSGLNKGYPFTSENVLTLKRSSIFIALVFPLQLIIYFLQLDIVHSYIPKVHNISIEPNVNWATLLIAAILYITAEIFNYGLELKKENEEFV